MCGVLQGTFDAAAPAPGGVRRVHRAPRAAPAPGLSGCLVWLATSGFQGFHEIIEAWRVPTRAALLLATQTGTGWAARWFPYPQLLLIVGGALLAGLLLVVGVEWFFRRKLFVMKPHELALQELEIAAHRARGNPALDHHAAVLQILHRYVRFKFGLTTHPNAETRDVLIVLAQSDGGPLSGDQRRLLQEVLDAPADALADTLEGIAEITRKGVRFVWATVCAPPGRVRRRPTVVRGSTAA